MTDPRAEAGEATTGAVVLAALAALAAVVVTVVPGARACAGAW